MTAPRGAPAGFARSIGSVGAAALIAQVLGLAASPLISRLFSQEEFGQFGLFFNLANVLVTIVLLGLTDALLAASSDDDARALLAAAIRSVLWLSPLMGLTTYVMIRTDTLGYAAIPTWSAAVIIVEVAAIGWVMVLQMWMIRLKAFGALAGGHVVLGATRALGQIGAGMVAAGFAGLAVAEAACRACVVLALAPAARTDLRHAMTLKSAAVVQVVRRYWLFPAFRTPSMLANNLGTALPPILVGMAYDVAATGLYTLMFAVIVAPSSLIQKAVGDVFLGHFAAEYRSEPTRARRLLAQVAGALFALSLAPALALWLWGPQLFALIFGEPWRAAGVLASLMVPALVADFTVGPLGGVLSVANRPDSKLLFDGARITGFVAAYAIATRRALPLDGMVTLIAAFTCVSYAIYAALILHATRYPRPVAPATPGSPAISD